MKITIVSPCKIQLRQIGVNVEAAKEKRNVDIILDTEFNMRVGDFKVDPISLAMVSDCGRHTLYEVSRDFNKIAANEHDFLVAQVLPKLPPVEARASNDQIALRIKMYFLKIIRERQPNRVTLWAKNGGMGDFTLLNLFLVDRLYDFMRAHGVERTYCRDLGELYQDLGRPELGLPSIDPSVAHTALGDALYGREMLLACQKIKAAQSAALELKLLG